MADFQEQVMGLTGLTIDASSTTPSRAELSTFLNDGVIDVTNKWLVNHLGDRDQFTRVSAEQTGNSSLDLNGAEIISVIRESGTNNDWRPCRKISPAMQSQVADTDSLSFASKYHPVYMVEDNGLISVFPAPDSDPDAFKVYYINNSPEETDGTALDHASTGIKYFPSDKIYLVIVYAAIQSLQAVMSNTVISLSITSPAVPVLTAVTFTSIDSALDASAPVFTTATISAASTYTGSVPTYTKPTLTLGAAPTISDLTISAVAPIVPSSPSFSTPTIGSITVASTLISNMGTPPTYTAPVFTSTSTYLTEMEDGTIGDDTHMLDVEQWFSIAGQLIEDAEDTELAQAHLQKISTFLQAFQADMQNQLNVFNDANVEYQAKLQEAIQQAQINAQKAQAQAQIDATDQQQSANLLLQKENQEYAAKLQKFNSEVQEYQANVAKEVQQYQQNLTGDLEVWQAERATDLQKYGTDVQNELNEFNKENAAYQSAIQESIQNLQVTNQINLAKAQADLQVALANKDRDQQRQLQNGMNDMQAIVANNQATVTRYQAEIQDYQAEVNKEIQEGTTKTQQYQGLYMQLLQQYNAAFQVAQPQQQQGAR